MAIIPEIDPQRRQPSGTEAQDGQPKQHLVRISPASPGGHLQSDAVRAATIPLPDYLIAASEEMRELVSVVRAVAPTLITVLLIGESGTGKEVFAKLIHDLSSRRNGPFITVNCGAIPEGLIESELFGHEKGAFTGAVGQRKGFFEAANGGTIFLDEIGEMPLAAQVKLLRVLETGTFTRVGSTTQLKTDARVVAATNRDLESQVRLGAFRSDLYYRLRAVMLRIPPLRNRREDIPFLIESLLEEFVKKHDLGQMPKIASDAIELLLNHEWRGNVRELRNVLEQLVILVCSISRQKDFCLITREDVERSLRSNSMPQWQDLSGADMRALPMTVAQMPKEQSERELLYRALIELRSEIAELKELVSDLRRDRYPVDPIHSTRMQSGVDGGAVNTNAVGVPILALPAKQSENHDAPLLSLEEIEHRAMHEALERFHGNRRQAAEALGISERTLYRKLKEQGIE